MSRYIDVDALIDAHYEYCNEHSYKSDAMFFSWSESLMKNAPSIDIVFCKDCEHWANNEDYDCEIHSGAWQANDHCSQGERKDDE